MALNSLFNRTLDTLRGGVGQATRAGKGAANQGAALGKRLTNRNPDPKSDMDDVTLARKVETEVFRPKGAPKGKVDVNAVDGVIWLRGEVKSKSQVESIEKAVRAIPEVKDVENLLHGPKTPAPSRTRGGAKKTTTKRKTENKRFERPASTAEKARSTKGEPLPKQAAETGAGRKPAPLGAQDTDAPAKTSSDSLTGGTIPTPAGNGGGNSTVTDD
jgi:hypothetical protein